MLIPPAPSQAAETSTWTLPPNAIKEIHVKRSDANPLINFQSSPSLGDNINGPSVIRVPSWIRNPLGKYYMYFAHHKGKYIRLAYADSLAGPWRIYESGVLHIDQHKERSGHIASPDVHVDDAKHKIRLYFHSEQEGQKTGVAISSNGLDFVKSDLVLGEFYFRVFRWKDYYYAIAKNGNAGWGRLYRSKDGVTPFEMRGDFIHMMRHAAVCCRGDYLLVFYSRVGDSPERIVVATVRLDEDWMNWRESVPMDVLWPEMDYEGVAFPNEPSLSGVAMNVRQVRDPCLFEENGRTFLFYSIAGEMGVAMATLEIIMKP